MTTRGNELECIGTIEPNSNFNVPVRAVYTPTGELFFSVSNYSVTNVPFVWKDLQSNVTMTKVLKSSSTNPEEINDCFIFKVHIKFQFEEFFIVEVVFAY